MLSIDNIVYNIIEPEVKAKPRTKYGFSRYMANSAIIQKKYKLFKEILDKVEFLNEVQPLKVTNLIVKKGEVIGFEDTCIMTCDISIMFEIYKKDIESRYDVDVIKSKNNKHNRYFLKKKECSVDKVTNPIVKIEIDSVSKNVVNLNHNVPRTSTRDNIMIKEAIKFLKNLYGKYGSNYHFKFSNMNGNKELKDKLNLPYVFSFKDLTAAKKSINSDNGCSFYIETLGGSEGSRFVSKQLGIDFNHIG